jgi:hypothetical protein
MKKIVFVLTNITLLIAITFIALIYKQYPTVATPESTPTTEVATSTDEQLAIAKTNLTASLDTSNLPPAEQGFVSASIDAQLTDDMRLHTMAVEAGTEVSQSAWFFAWQREVYKHGDEAGLSNHITSLGLDDASYRTNLERNLRMTTFLENIAGPRVTDVAVRTYYDNLPTDQRDDFEVMAPEIRETLLNEATIAARRELLAS